MELRHFCTPIAGGFEFISVCPRHAEKLPDIWEEKGKDVFAHRSCDLCEFEDGLFSARECFFHENGLLSDQENVK